MDSRVAVVIATRDRMESLGRSLDRLCSLPEAPQVVVVDNASSDGTAECVRRHFPMVELIRLEANFGAAARTSGVRAAAARYVAFSDDDSWWSPGALSRAADLFDQHHALGVVVVRVLVGSDQKLDPTCAEMAASPIPARPGLPGRAVLGFLACGSVVRRSAFLEIGGFEPRFGVGGEEELLALDFAAAGWELVYADEVVAHHQPQAAGVRRGRERMQRRNALWSAWLRRPWPVALSRTIRLLGSGPRRLETWLAFTDALKGLPWVVRSRQIVPREVEAALRLIERRAGIG